MKKIIIFLIFAQIIFAQKPCELAESFTDSIGTYKSTNEFLVHERIFSDKEAYIFLSLINNNGTPALNLKIIQKSNEFIKANCMSASTKLLFQLENGKIITMIHNNEESCGTFHQNPDDKKNTRFTSGLFLFLLGTIEELKKSPIQLMRIQNQSETKDYVMVREFTSELTMKLNSPENFFIDNLHCVE